MFLGYISEMKITTMRLLFTALICLMSVSVFGQNACKECSDFSVNEDWTSLIECLNQKISISNSIPDLMCRVQCYAIISEKTDSINLSGSFITRLELLELSLKDLHFIIESNPNFANGLPLQQSIFIKKQLGKEYCSDLKLLCEIIGDCEDYNANCRK